MGAEFQSRYDSAGDVGQGERRHGRRHITVLRIAKVVRPHGDELCVIRNISDGGVMAHLYAPAHVGEHVAIEFKSGARLGGTVRWVRGDDAGIQFDQAIDITAFLGGEGDVAGVEPRAPRLEVGMPAVMRVGIRMRPITVCNISQGGLKVAAIEGIAPDQAVVTRIAGLDPLAGRVRWCDHKFAGIEFDAPIAFPVLARWAADSSRPR